jgi:hypothetical protein
LKSGKNKILFIATILLLSCFFLKAQELYVGANYHPHDDKIWLLNLNVSGEPKEIPIKGNSRSILFDKDYTGNFTIAPYEPEFIEVE